MAVFLLASLCAPAAGQQTPGSMPVSSPSDVLTNVHEGVWTGRIQEDGFLDEPLVFRGETGGDDSSFRIQVSAAVIEGGSSRRPLYLVPRGENALLDPAAIVGPPVKAAGELTLLVPKGRRNSVRLVGGPFRSLNKIYWARLVAVPLESGKEAERAYFYRLRLEPRITLGLKAAELERDEEINPGTTASIDDCIPTERTPAVKLGFRLKTPATPIEGSHALPANSVAVGVEPCGLRVSLRDLPRGRYASVLDVNGEDLLVKVTLKHPWWVVPLLILGGALLSFAIREALRYFQRRSDIETRIARIRDQLNQRDRLTVWDDLRFRNALRRAEGALGFFELPELEAALEEAASPALERLEIDAIRKALTETALPREVKRQIDRSLRAVTRLSSAADEPRIASLLTGLKKRADNGFRSDLQAWMEVLRKYMSQRRPELEAARARAPLSDRIGNLLDRALRTLEDLIQDADDLLASGIPLASQHTLLLESIPGAIDGLLSGVTDQSLTEAQLLDLTYASLPAAPQTAALVPVPDLQSAPKVELKVVLPEDGKVSVLQVATFELQLSPPPEDEILEHLQFLWTVDGEPTFDGGPRLTWLFSGRRGREAKVSASIVGKGGTELKPDVCELQLARRPSQGHRSDVRLWMTRTAATVVAVAVTSVVALALFWSEKPFGQLTDYVAMFAVGLGADAGLVAGGGQLLGKILGSFGLDSKSAKTS